MRLVSLHPVPCACPRLPEWRCPRRSDRGYKKSCAMRMWRPLRIASVPAALPLPFSGPPRRSASGSPLLTSQDPCQRWRQVGIERSQQDGHSIHSLALRPSPSSTP